MDAITTVKTAESIASSQFVWAILFILLTTYLLWIQRQDKKEWREDRKESLEIQKAFNDSLSSQASTMKEISSTLNETNKSLQSLEVRMDGIERNSYMRNVKEYNRRGGE